MNSTSMTCGVTPKYLTFVSEERKGRAERVFKEMIAEFFPK